MYGGQGGHSNNGLPPYNHIAPDRSASLPWNQPGVRDTLLHRAPPPLPAQPGAQGHGAPPPASAPPPGLQPHQLPSAVLPLSNAVQAAAAQPSDAGNKEDQLKAALAQKQQLVELSQGLIAKFERLQEDFGHAKQTIATLREDVEKFGREVIDTRKKLHDAERRAATAEDTAARMEQERDLSLESLDAAKRRIGDLEREMAEEKQKQFNIMRDQKNAEYRRQWQLQQSQQAAYGGGAVVPTEPAQPEAQPPLPAQDAVIAQGGAADAQGGEAPRDYSKEWAEYYAQMAAMQAAQGPTSTDLEAQQSIYGGGGGGDAGNKQQQQGMPQQQQQQQQHHNNNNNNSSSQMSGGASSPAPPAQSPQAPAPYTPQHAQYTPPHNYNQQGQGNNTQPQQPYGNAPPAQGYGQGYGGGGAPPGGMSPAGGMTPGGGMGGMPPGGGMGGMPPGGGMGGPPPGMMGGAGRGGWPPMPGGMPPGPPPGFGNMNNNMGYGGMGRGGAPPAGAPQDTKRTRYN